MHLSEVFFSIILPTYNRAGKITKAIESILSQSYKNWELIIIDNYSKDNTEQIVNNYKCEKILYFKLNNNGVIAKSRNFGIKKAKGENLCFLDSDDWWKPNKLEVTYQYLKQGYDFIYHDMFISRNKQILRKKTGYC